MLITGMVLLSNCDPMRAYIGVIISTMLMALIISGCINYEDSPIRIRDAYCDNNGAFNFSLENLDDDKLDIEYRWTLNDPKADAPVYKGQGNTTLQKDEVKHFSITIEDPEEAPMDYDSRFYIMHITIIKNEETIVKYREQKSPYDWDYSTLPPRKLK
jgi:hypothetical protein